MNGSKDAGGGPAHGKPGLPRPVRPAPPRPGRAPRTTRPAVRPAGAPAGTAAGTPAGAARTTAGTPIGRPAADPDATAVLPRTGAPPPRVPPARDVTPTGRHRRRSRRRAARVLSWIAVALSATLLLTAGGGYLLLNYYNGNIQRLPDVFGAGDRPADAQGPLDILLVGSDSREGLTGQDAFQGTGKEFITGRRSDTIILMHLYGSGRRVQLVSFPRDSYVTIPAHPDPKTGKAVPAHEDRINSAYQEGGPALLVKTVESLTGVGIDHYAQVDFTGFKTMVDRLGGVEVCLSEPAKEIRSGIDLPAGRQVVRGDQALAFVRQRQGLPRGDVDRIQRQQRFLGSMVDKVLSSGTLLNPIKLNGFLQAATDSLEVDKDLTFSKLRALALRLRGLRGEDVVFTTVPIADLAARRDGASVVILDDAAAQPLYRSLRDDVVPSPSPAPGPPLTVAPERIRVQVLDGSGPARLGRGAADDLAGVGFLARAGGTAAPVPRTVVVYGPDRADSARTVAAAVPGAQLRADPALAGRVQLVVGPDYAGAQDVTVTPAPDGGVDPQVRTAAADPCA